MAISHITPRAAGVERLMKLLRISARCWAATTVKDALRVATRARHVLSSLTVDIGREPDGRNGHNGGAKKLEAVGDHYRIADWHARAGPELGHVETSDGPKLVSNTWVKVDGLPHESLNVSRRLIETRRDSAPNRPMPARGSFLPQGRIASKLRLLL